MIGAGTVINPIIKIVTTVAILAAVGFFIVRPILDTTENAINSVSEGVRNAQQQSRQQSAEMDLSFSRSRAESFVAGLQSTWPAAAREGERLRRAPRATTRGRWAAARTSGRSSCTRCVSDRSFALSYADSLGAQGRGADADRVQACVKRAGFAPAAMQRCRKLADDLLFG